jgi:hypothetical protein
MAPGIEEIPPLAITPTNANCDPPLNIKRLNTMVCHMSSPAAEDRAPKEMPYKPVARPTLIEIDLVLPPLFN